RITPPAWLFSAAICEVSALPSHARKPLGETFLLCGKADISTWLQHGCLAVDSQAKCTIFIKTGYCMEYEQWDAVTPT
ncbi:hypothetical protein, partial [Sedimentitalea sp.]|uniref:hypothetical protein n=1 Tax=Sedimentitalea sp. TaxID=2048915 RepID=UPI003296EB25